MNFDEFKTKAAETLNTVANAATRAADSARVSVNVYSEEEKIKTAYRELGKLFYADAKAGRPVSGPAYEEQIAKVDASMARIRKLREEDSVKPSGSEPGAEGTPDDMTELAVVTDEDFAD